MTEIVAAHLERVARLNEILDEIAAGRGPFKVDNWDFACSVIENSKALAKEAKELLAAALAACARERDRSNREYYKEVLNKANRCAAAWLIDETPILSEAERAVGEKAT